MATIETGIHKMNAVAAVAAPDLGTESGGLERIGRVTRAARAA